MAEWDIRREGRAWHEEAMRRYEMTPEKTEMYDGKLYATEEERLAMLALLLENVGADKAVRLGDPDVWRAAVAALGDDGVSRPGGEGPPSGDRDALEHVLVTNLRLHRESLAAHLEACSNHWGYEDSLYRFYHQSYKVFRLQERTEEIVARLRDLVPERPLHPWFLEILRQGTGKTFTPEDNRRWTLVTRPIVEAFFHARFFLEMAVRYGSLDRPPRPLPSGYAALLYLFQLR